MSTRRTTRATSKVASSRGASSRGPSPAITESDIPATPSGRRSTRRAGSTTPLPVVASRSSTAYGTNATAQPAWLRVPESGEEINSALNSILQPQSNTLAVVHEEDTASEVGHSRGRRGRGRASSSLGGRRLGRGTFDNSSIDRSFGNESRIFGEADIESSIAEMTEFTGIPEFIPALVQPLNLSRRTSPSEEDRSEDEREQRKEVHRDHARTPVNRSRVRAEPIRESFQQMKIRYVETSLDLVASLISSLNSGQAWMKNHLGKFGLALTALILLTLLSSSGPYRWYGFNLKNNVGQFVPNIVAHPLSAFSPSDLNDLQSRITAAEYDIKYLKQRNDIDEAAISHLKQVLPSHIVVKKTKSGRLEITQEFWHALDSKMRSEYPNLSGNSGQPSKDSSTRDVSLAQVEALMEQPKMWNRFLLNNRAQLKELAGEEIDARLPDKLEDSLRSVVSKEEFARLVRQSWEDSHTEVKAEIRKLSKQLEQTVHHAGNTEVDTAGYNKAQIKAISTDVFRSLFNNAQLEALAKANKNINVAATQQRVNHFSPGTGAIINPRLTSPNYLFPSMKPSFSFRALALTFWKPVPTPNPPEVALQRWEEHGDCWCAKSEDTDGSVPSLAVIMANKIYPEQIIIEHIPSSGSLEPGAAPKAMELLAYIEDREAYHRVKQRSDEIFHDEAKLDEQQLNGYVRIATWDYDAHALSNIQSFGLQVELRWFKGHAYTNRVIVRAKNNWGADFTCLYRIRMNGDVA